MAADKCRVLVVVGSSGDSPYTDIEEKGQMPTFGQAEISGVDCVWVEGDASLSNRWRFLFLNKNLELVHRNLYLPTIQIELCRNAYALVDGALTKKSLSPTISGARRRIRVRVNWGHLLATTYNPAKNKNGFSRILASLLSRLADGKPLRKGNRVTLSFPNSYFLSPWRSFLRYKTVLELFEFDFVLFTTSTCYVDLLQLREAVRHLPRTRLYAGHLMKLGTEFIAGNSILMTRDVVESVVLHKTGYRLDVPDDVALGFLIKDFGLAEIHELSTETLPFDCEIPRDLSPRWSDRFLFRCKAETPTINPEPAIRVMTLLHSYIVEQRKAKQTGSAGV